MKNAFLLLAILFIATACGRKGPTEPAYLLKNIGEPEAKMLVHYGTENGTLTVLDVRSAQEFASGHLKGAINIDYNGADFASRLEDIDKNKDLLVYCASGGRSTACLETLEAAGFRKVFHLDGGIKAWRAGGNPITKK